MLLSVLNRTQLFVVLIIGGLATALGENAEVRLFTKMPRAHFTKFGGTAPALRGCLAPWGLFERSAEPTVMLSESIAGRGIHSGRSRASAAKYPRFDTCHHVQADAFFRARTQIVAAGSIAHERRRPNAR